MIRIFIADDHAMVRVGLRHVLAELGGFGVVGEADNGRAALKALETCDCDVLVLDLSLPVVSGTEVLKQVRARWPNLAVVVHSMYPEAEFRRRSIEAGAIAYVPKDAPTQRLIDAVRRAAAWPHRVQNPIGTALADQAQEPAPHTSLSRREHQVFMLLIEGRVVADIAAELNLHSSTVSNHLAQIRAKLGVQTVPDIMRYAWTHDLVDPGPRFEP